MTYRLCSRVFVSSRRRGPEPQEIPFFQSLLACPEFPVKGLLLGFCVLLYSGELSPVAKGLYGVQKDAYFPYFGA